MIFTTWQSRLAQLLAVGVKLVGTKRTSVMFLAFRYSASWRALTQGAPMISNGVSVPRPTEIFVPSTSPTLGYKVASFKLRKLGEGLTQSTDVESNQSPRIPPCTATTLSRALILRSAC